MQGAIKTRVEENQQRSKVAELEAQGNTQRAAALRRRLDAPSDAELQNDVTALAAELQRCYQNLKRMPTRAELRADQRRVLHLVLPFCPPIRVTSSCMCPATHLGFCLVIFCHCIPALVLGSGGG